jgi:3-oxoacyl-[acyl-carrier protein] reductase
VTGASQGIGRSTAVRLARDFGSVVLVARNRTKLEETAAAVAAANATPLLIDLDLSERSSAIARYGKPEEIAELIAFLVSPGARWMTGSTLRMDGGEVKSI